MKRVKNVNCLQIGILAIGLAASATCRAQNGLMLTTVVDFYNNGFPFSQLVQGNDGVLYGTAWTGGAFGYGAIFKTTLTGSVTNIFSFSGTNGGGPLSLILAADGNFYGTTSYGGTGENGTVYKLDTNGALTTLFFFSGNNGEEPAAMIQGSDGALYGITEFGGSITNEVNTPGDGTVFRITTNGDFTLLASFDGTNSGFQPLSIIQAGDGNFYGTTDLGGPTNGQGVVFKVTPDGQLTNLCTFQGTNGCDPNTVLLGSDGAIYGTTLGGGSFYSSTNGGYGTVFRITTNGDFTLLASLDYTNGMQPVGLAEVGTGLFYGTASAGGLYPNPPGTPQQFNNDGTFFRVSTNGDLTALISFAANPLLPAFPGNALIKASDGNYYGAAEGANLVGVSGCIFSIRPIQAPFLQPLAQGSQLNLSWNAWAGYSYNLMYETNLTGSNWTLLSTTTPQTNGPATYSDNIGPDAQRFYTVVLQLP